MGIRTWEGADVSTLGTSLLLEVVWRKKSGIILNNICIHNNNSNALILFQNGKYCFQDFFLYNYMFKPTFDSNEILIYYV